MSANRSILIVASQVGFMVLLLVGHRKCGALRRSRWSVQHGSGNICNDKNLVVIDVYDGDQRAAFASGHIPGALFTDFSHGGWRAKVGAAPGMLPAIKDAEKVIGSYGIDNNSHVVLVPGGRERADFNAVTRIYWTFKALGHDDVSILNGGDKAWFADEANPVATGATKATPKKFVAHFRREYLATRADVKRAIRTHDAVLVDTRPPEQYEGKKKSPAARVAGTLPGAVNLPVEYLERPTAPVSPIRRRSRRRWPRRASRRPVSRSRSAIPATSRPAHGSFCMRSRATSRCRSMPGRCRIGRPTSSCRWNMSPSS